MLLVLTAPTDPHADRVIDLVVGEGIDVLRFDPADYPSKAVVTFGRERSGQGRASLELGGRSVSLDSIEVVWYRRPGRPAPHPDTPPAQRADVEDQSSAFIEDLWSLLDAVWVPARPNVLRGIGKLACLEVAADIGLQTPATLVTNDPREFTSFYRRHDGNVVSKLIGRSPVNAAESPFARFTEVVEPWQVTQADSVRRAPVIFQANVRKEYELRVTVIGYEVFAARIDSQATSHTRIYWRRYDHRNTPVTAIDLPTDVTHRLLTLVARLGLSFAAIDLIATPDGECVFVELNPNGQYLWIEEATGLPLSKALAAHLVRLDRPKLART